MNHPKQRHGNHTWDLILHYYRCSKCGYIMENHDKFEPYFQRLEKKLICPRCQHAFKIEKNVRPTLGPFFGHNPEVDE